MKYITELSPDAFSESISGKKTLRDIEEVTVRFAGDSGDGMQLTGSQFTSTTAIFGNDLSTFPDFPAEIRAPAGTVAGVSGFQIHFSSQDIHTPGDNPEVLVAMNPAALKANLDDVKNNGVIIINEDAFVKSNLKKVGYEENPAENGAITDRGFHLISVPISTLTKKALEEIPISDKDKARAKNMFALGIAYWLFDRPMEPTERWIRQKFSKKPDIAEANILALKAGQHFGDVTELLPIHFRVQKATLPPGIYRNITGNQALSLGLLAATKLAKTPLFLGSYPITPASDILHELSNYKNFQIRTFQAEDEIAAVCAAIGASYAGFLGLTTTSGPGLALKSEAINLAIMAELPLVIVNVQRGGPSTGLPTKVEQSDLLQSMFGRNGDSPLCVIAPKSPSDCFEKAIMAFRLAITHMTPVLLLSDGFLANGSEPWKLPNQEDLEPIEVRYKTELKEGEEFAPYSRDELLARPWVKPGTPALEHRIGGLERQNITGGVSYDPQNHQEMTWIRYNKIQKITPSLPQIEVTGDQDASSIIIGWGSTHGAITASVEAIRKSGQKIAQAHIEYISPFPPNTEEILKKYKDVFIVEMNTGQLAMLLQGKYAVKIKSITKIQGKPFMTSDILKHFGL